MTRTRFPALLAGAGLGLVLVAWLTIAPASLGGSVHYMTTTGDSMEPALSDGDLVLVRPSSTYSPGDIIAYRHPEIGIVVHRLVRRTGEGYLVKGDNNVVSDVYEPSRDQIIGAVWADIPGAGRWLERLETPWLGALALGVAGLLVMVPLGIGLPLGDRRRILQSELGRRFWPRLGEERVIFLLGPTGQAFTALLTMIAAAALILAILAYNRSTERVVSESIEYEQRAGIGYTAAASGNVYPQGVVTYGDPIYRALVDELTIQLDYEIDSELAVSGNGSYRIDALVQRSDGWLSTIPLQGDTPFSGTDFEGAALVRLEEVESAIDDFESQTGIPTSAPDAYTISVLADVTFDGTVGDDVIHEFSTTRLAFDLTESSLQLVETSDEPRNAMETVKTGTVSVEEEMPNTVDLGALELEVRTARMTAQAGLFLAILGGIVLTLLMRKALTAPEPVQIAARYRSRILPIQGAQLPSPARVIAVTSFDDLLRVADLKQQPILYFVRDDAHYYPLIEQIEHLDAELAQLREDVRILHRRQTLSVSTVGESTDQRSGPRLQPLRPGRPDIIIESTSVAGFWQRLKQTWYYLPLAWGTIAVIVILAGLLMFFD